MRTSRKRRCLREEPSVHERSREVPVRFPLDDDAPVYDVIADVEPFEVDFKVGGLLEEIEKDCVSLCMIDAELMPPFRGGRGVVFWRGSQKSAIG